MKYWELTGKYLIGVYLCLKYPMFKHEQKISMKCPFACLELGIFMKCPFACIELAISIRSRVVVSPPRLVIWQNVRVSRLLDKPVIQFTFYVLFTMKNETFKRKEETISKCLQILGFSIIKFYLIAVSAKGWSTV